MWRRRVWVVAAFSLLFTCLASASEAQTTPAAESEETEPSGEAGFPELYEISAAAAPCLQLRTAPRQEGVGLRCLEVGKRLTAVASDEDWLKVRLRDGAEGWMAWRYLVAVGPERVESEAGTPRGSGLRPLASPSSLVAPSLPEEPDDPAARIGDSEGDLGGLPPEAGPAPGGSDEDAGVLRGQLDYLRSALDSSRDLASEQRARLAELEEANRRLARGFQEAYIEKDRLRMELEQRRTIDDARRQNDRELRQILTEIASAVDALEPPGPETVGPVAELAELRRRLARALEEPLSVAAQAKTSDRVSGNGSGAPRETGLESGAAFPRPTPSSLTRVERISWVADAGGTWITLECDGLLSQYDLSHQPLATREVIWIRDAEQPYPEAVLAVGTPEVAQIHTRFDPEAPGLEVAVDLADATVRVTRVEPQGSRLVLYLEKP